MRSTSAAVWVSAASSLAKSALRPSASPPRLIGEFFTAVSPLFRPWTHLPTTTLIAGRYVGFQSTAPGFRDSGNRIGRSLGSGHPPALSISHAHRDQLVTLLLV